MAHPCISCGKLCNCGAPQNCCECYECQTGEPEEVEFIRCDKCDGHDACEDFGCAYEHGLGRMVKKDIPHGSDDWG